MLAACCEFDGCRPNPLRTRSRLTLHIEPELCFANGQLEANGCLQTSTALPCGSPIKLLLYRTHFKPPADVIVSGQAVALRAAQLGRGPYLQVLHMPWRGCCSWTS